MGRYRKRPVVIDAVQYTPENDEELLHFLGDTQFVVVDEGIEIRTLEGDMLAQPNDWIIRGIKGEFYPCKPDIFEATYEKVE